MGNTSSWQRYSGSQFNKVKTNISKEELEAVKTLITLQKERVIIIKPCDKGGGIKICDFDKYSELCINHLESKTVTNKKIYRESSETELIEMKQKIRTHLRSGLKAEIITEEEYLSVYFKFTNTVTSKYPKFTHKCPVPGHKNFNPHTWPL